MGNRIIQQAASTVVAATLVITAAAGTVIVAAGGRGGGVREPRPSADVSIDAAAAAPQAAIRQLFETDLCAGRHQEIVQAFYSRRDYRLAWFHSPGCRAALVFVKRMQAAEDDGLRAADYRASVWNRRLQRCAQSRSGSGRDRFAEDVEFTATLVRFASDLAYGVGHLRAPDRQTHILSWLEQARDAPSARQALAAIEPRHPEYRRLRKAMRAYREIHAHAPWPRLPEGILLRRRSEPAAGKDGKFRTVAEAREKALRALRKRLAITGDLHNAGREVETVRGLIGPQKYDAALEAAVRRFQSRHGLLVDGIVGPETAAALNVSVAARIQQLAINMNRWRRMPDELGNTHVNVNIPRFRLDVVERGRTVQSMRVVVGTPDRPTPVMHEKISYLVFRPYWNVPDRIAKTELLPRIAEDPEYVQRQRLEIVDGRYDRSPVIDAGSIDWKSAAASFPYRLRQRAGPYNSLGLLKFMFPNRHSIYVHDTPATLLFNYPVRAYSHGCVRVEDPVALAEVLLRNQAEWSREAIRQAMRGNERRIVRLVQPVPIYMTYFTAWTEGGAVQFRRDIYGLDAAEAQALGSAIAR